MTFKLRNLLLLTLLVYLTSLSGCKKDETKEPDSNVSWNKIGLDGLFVNRLAIKNNILYAATNNGIYKKSIRTDEAFTSIGLQGKNILDLIVFTESEIIVTVGSRLSITQEPGLYKTTNSGGSWQAMGYFGIDGVTEEVKRLYQDSAQPNTIYAGGPAIVAKSVDKGASWQKIYGFWQGAGTGVDLLGINPKNSGEFWYGGQGPIENGYLGYLKNGDSFKEWSNLVSNPSGAREIVFDTLTKQTIYVGFSGGLVKTSDNGNTWKMVMDGYQEGLRFFYGIGISRHGPKTVFAGGWLKQVEPQPLTLFVSKDSGETWESLTYPDEVYGGVYHLKVVSEAGRDRIFLALARGGVYEVIMSH